MDEIEVTVRHLAGVRDCVALPVMAPDGQVGGLALFYLADPEAAEEDEGDPLAIRDQLQRLLPGYLVPGVVRRMDRFPVTANGKTDGAELLRHARRSGRSGRPANPVPASEAPR
jgi:acyl-CoA synthetase (AMP-forming)/AMP-acid ligase II